MSGDPDKKIAEALWEQGYTNIRRHRDPTQFLQNEIPATRAYQWMHAEHDKVMYENRGWAPVEHSRHPGRFAPWGTDGHIIWQSLGLFEKPKYEVEAELAANTAKAHQNVADWLDKAAAQGFTGAATVGDDVISVGNNTLELATPIPKDMFEHMAAIFAERDRLVKEYLPEVEAQAGEIGAAFAEHMKKYPDAPKWPTLHGMLMPKAIENVRKRIAQEA